jgi:uncharacterized membrane protein required for colicin V production
MGFIVIDYDTLILVAVFAFAAIGLSRGWLTEFINTILLVLLSILLFNPEMLAPILERLNQLLKLLLAMFRSGLDLGDAVTVFRGMDDIIDPANPYPVLLMVTIALLAMQYAGTRFKLTAEISAFSRILGAVLGAINANIVVSLVKEAIRRYTQVAVSRVSAQEALTVQAQVASVQALAPNGVAVALKDAPVGFLPDSYLIWVGGAVLAIGAVLLVSHLTKKPVGTP